MVQQGGCAGKGIACGRPFFRMAVKPCNPAVPFISDARCKFIVFVCPSLGTSCFGCNASINVLIGASELNAWLGDEMLPAVPCGSCRCSGDWFLLWLWKFCEWEIYIQCNVIYIYIYIYKFYSLRDTSPAHQMEAGRWVVASPLGPYAAMLQVAPRGSGNENNLFS